MKNLIEEVAKEFSSQSHGSSDYWKDTIFVRGEKDDQFVPLSYLQKKHPDRVKSLEQLQGEGYVYSSLDFLES